MLRKIVPNDRPNSDHNITNKGKQEAAAVLVVIHGLSLIFVVCLLFVCALLSKPEVSLNRPCMRAVQYSMIGQQSVVQQFILSILLYIVVLIVEV